MNFNQGDQIVHPSFGIGTIAGVEEMDFAGDRPRLFYRVDFVRTTVWVPVQAQRPGGMRPITRKRELDRYRDLLRSAPACLDDNFRNRQLELENRLADGTFQALCEVVRDLYARDCSKALNSFDLALLKKARAALIQEWAVTSGISPHDANGEIDGYLLKGRQSAAV